MASKININLDTSKENYLVAKCKQNDDLTLEASIFENGLALDLTNKTITIQALKSDNTYIIQNTDIVKENNKINAELDRDFSRVPGTTKIEIVLVESSKQNTTFSFYLEVVGSVIRGAVQSSNTATILEALDNKIIEAGQVKQETEELVQSGGAATKGEVQEINASLEQNMNIISGIISVKNFGAKGDGVTNDTEAIQRALNYAESNKPNTVFFPTGTYVIAGQGKIFNSKFVSLVGDNAKFKVIQGDKNTDIFNFIGTSINHNGIVSGLEFTYATDDFTMINNVFKFTFEKASDILYGLEISRCLFRKNYGYKIYTEGFSNGGFNNCRFNNNIVYGKFMKSLSFGDSNKIIGNSLYGSEQIQLDDYVISLIQTSGSAGCEISSNNCTSGLGYFKGLRRFKMTANQVENTTQANLDYLIKLDFCREGIIECCNIVTQVNTNSKLLYSSGNSVRVISCVLNSPSGILIESPNHPLIVSQVVSYLNGINNVGLLPYGSCTGLVTNYQTINDGVNIGYVDENMVWHLYSTGEKSVSIAPWKFKGNMVLGTTFQANGGAIYFNSNTSFKFTSNPITNVLIDATY